MEYPIHQTSFQPHIEPTDSSKEIRSQPFESVIIKNVETELSKPIPESVTNIPTEEDWKLLREQTTNHHRYNRRSIDCLTNNIYHEARGESDEGKRAVIRVVLNRLNEENFPNSICSIVYQPGQFSWVDDHKVIDDWKTWKELRTFTEIYLSRIETTKDMTYGSTYYYAVGSTKPDWAYKFRKVGRIGNHVFYKPRRPA